MRLFVPNESSLGESRTALTPASAARLGTFGLTVTGQKGLGEGSGYPDTEYEVAGVKLVPAEEAGSALEEADVVARVRKPDTDTVARLKNGSWHFSLLDPWKETDLVRQFADQGVSAVSLEMIPRTTLAQKMDVLSSQANLAGYFAVLLAASHLGKLLPMMMTPAGTIQPARVFIIGVGVAGLQAIATAKRLGARVEAFDTRPVVEEQVRSLGARFVKIDLGETGQTDQGYAKALTPEQLEKQRLGMLKACQSADIIITTAKLFGRPAPRLLTSEMLNQLRSGTIIVDLAVETGGNVEGSIPGREVVLPNGVRILGQTNLEARVAHHASQMYAANIANLIEHYYDRSSGRIMFRPEETILKSCLLTHGGTVVHPSFLNPT